MTEVAVSAQAPFAAIIGMQSPTHAQRIVSLVASNAADYGLLHDALSDTGKREAIAGSVAILRTSGIHSQFVGDHYYVGALPWWLLLWYHLADHPALLAVLATLVVLMVAFLLRAALGRGQAPGPTDGTYAASAGHRVRPRPVGTGRCRARAAQALPAPGGTVAEQRQWLLQQVRIGEATGRQSLIEDALARLRVLAPDDRGTLVAILEVQLSQQKLQDAEATLKRLREIGTGTRELVAGERLWRAYRGDLQQDLQQARLFAAGGRSAEALAIYRRLFNDDPPACSWAWSTGAAAARRMGVHRRSVRWANWTAVIRAMCHCCRRCRRCCSLPAAMQRRSPRCSAWGVIRRPAAWRRTPNGPT